MQRTIWLPEEIWYSCLFKLNLFEIAQFATVCNHFTKSQILINYGRKALFEQKWASIGVTPTTTWKQAFIERVDINWNNGVTKFNIKPEDGIRYLLDEHMIENSPEAVAQFLREDKRINKLLIGSYIASTPIVMKAYMKTFDWKDLVVDLAFRDLLTQLALPDSTKAIGFLIGAYAERYLECNKHGIFKSADAVFALTYSILMLNTDLHNDIIKKKMTIESFVQGLIGINDKSDIPKALIEEIYTRTKEHQILDARLLADRKEPPKKKFFKNLLKKK